MEFGIIGLGRMGANMARRLGRQGAHIAVLNRSHDVALEIAEETGHLACETLQELVDALEAPRIVWLMLPAGDVTEATLQALGPILSPGDLIVDGGNSFYKDVQRRTAWLEDYQVEFCDVGVSGGIWGLEKGYCLMFGASRKRPRG